MTRTSGANDMKPWIHGNPVAAKQGISRLIDIVRGHDYPFDWAAPQILIVAPPAVSRTDNAEFKEMFAGGDEASKRLAPQYSALADEAGCGFFDSVMAISCDVSGTGGCRRHQVRRIGLRSRSSCTDARLPARRCGKFHIGGAIRRV